MKKLLPIGLLIFISCTFLVSSAPAQMSRQFFASERFVIRSVRQIHGAQATFQAVYGVGNFGTIVQLRDHELIDAALASGSKYGYTFSMTVTPHTPTTPSYFSLTATPTRYPKTGRRSFFINEKGDVRGADKSGEPANENDPFVDDCALFGREDNERCTLQSLRYLENAEGLYISSHGNNTNYGTLQQLGAAFFILQSLATGQKHGYVFSVTVFARQQEIPARYTVTATPQSYPNSGVRSFFINESGIIRGADHKGEPATVNDPPVDPQY